MIVVKELKKPWWAECTVCKTEYKNWAGSTPCCGALAIIVEPKKK